MYICLCIHFKIRKYRLIKYIYIYIKPLKCKAIQANLHNKYYTIYVFTKIIITITFTHISY